MDSSADNVIDHWRQSVIEHMQELTGNQLDHDVIEMILSEYDWKGTIRQSFVTFAVIAYRYSLKNVICCSISVSVFMPTAFVVKSSKDRYDVCLFIVCHVRYVFTVT